jgi:hypothetical protein
MYHGKNFLLPVNRAQLAEGQWFAVVLYLWTKGVMPPTAGSRSWGLPDGQWTRGARFSPTIVKYSKDLAFCVRAGLDGCDPGGVAAQPSRDLIRVCERGPCVQVGDDLPPLGL